MATATFPAFYGSGDGITIASYQTGTIVLDTAPGDDALTVGETFTVSLNGGPPQTYTFEGSNGFGIIGSSGITKIYLSNTDLGDVTGNDFDTSFPVTSTDPILVCFAAGTLIATPGGERTVEALEIGDLVMTADGRTVPVKWIGRQTVSKLFTPAERFEPVRISTGALGGGLPHTDLVLTTDHALILYGLAITAGALVNGTTITREPASNLPDRVTYYHIETENHEVIMANGAAAETYVDYVQRSAFDNHCEYIDLYGEERTIAEMGLPRVSSARLLPQSIRARLAGNAAA